MKYYYRQKKIIVPVWNRTVYLVDTNDNVALNKKHNTELETMPNAHTFRIKETKDYVAYRYDILVLNTRTPLFNNSYGTLCHEAAHITGSILEIAGVDANFANDEAFCYLVQYIFNEGAKFFFNFKYE